MTLREIVFAFRAAAVAADRGRADTTARADAFFEMISAVPVLGPAGEPWAAQAFETVIAQVELLPPERTFEPTMIAADALAACILASTAHADIVRRWSDRDHPAPRTGALRVCSKLCEYDTSLVDGDLLCRMAKRLDGMGALSKSDETTLGYLGQVAGRLRGEDKGMRLIEQLAAQGPPSRVIAAHAIGYSIAMDPPSSRLSVFERLGASRLVSAAPTRRLMQLFVALGDDTDPTVAAAAEQSASVIRYAWPELEKRMANVTMTVKGLPKSPHARSIKPQPRSVDFALHAPSRVNLRYGVMTWIPELLEQDIQAEAAGERLPPIVAGPRLFISYRWSDEIGEDTLIDFLAGRLHGLGYDISFDRDPRHLDKGQSAEDMLNLLPGCTHFVPVVTDELSRYLAHQRTGPKSALDLEWDLARKLSRREHRPQWLSLWTSGDRLPRALAARAFVDLRDNMIEALDAAFPRRRFQVVAFDDRDKVLHRSPTVDRLHLRATFSKVGALRGCARCEIRDVTPHAQLPM